MIAQYFAKFLQEPRYITITHYEEPLLIPQQPTTWEFQESSDYANWTDVIDLGDAYFKVSCESYFTSTSIIEVGEYDQNSLCYYTIKWLHPTTTWIRARAVQEEPYWSHENYSFEMAVSHSDWSEPLLVTTVPEPSTSLLLLVGTIVLILLKRPFRVVGKSLSLHYPKAS
jgi:hypothetical protein